MPSDSAVRFTFHSFSGQLVLEEELLGQVLELVEASRRTAKRSMPPGVAFTAGVLGPSEPLDLGRVEHVALEEDQRALDGVLQLAHVAGPGLGREELEGLRRELGGGGAPVGLRSPRRGTPSPAGGCRCGARAAAARPRARRRGGSRGPRGTAPSSTALRRSLFVAATTRTSTLICTPPPPTRWRNWSSSTRSTFVWASSGMSPTSSRNSVPPSACSNLPFCRSTAPVNAPFSWPKSVLSISSRGIAPQFTATKGPCARGLISWTRRATSSLPEPFSPWISTRAGVGATFAIDVAQVPHGGAVAEHAARDVGEPVAQRRVLAREALEVARLADLQQDRPRGRAASR